MKKDEVARSEKIEADRAQETWDSEGGRRAPRPDEVAARQPPCAHPAAFRRVFRERRQGDRRLATPLGEKTKR